MHDAEREDVDAWIMYSKGQHPGYSVTRLFGEEVFPVCSPQFRKTLSAHPGADEVIGQPLLHDMYWDTDWPDWARAVGATAGELAANMRFALYKGVIQAAVDGMGMAVGHGEMVAKELATGKLVPLAHLSVVSEKSYHLVMTASSANDRTLVRLKEWLLQECAGGMAVERLTVPGSPAPRRKASQPRSFGRAPRIGAGSPPERSARPGLQATAVRPTVPFGQDRIVFPGAASPTSADPPPSSRRLRFPVTGRPASGSLASDSGQSGRTSPPPRD